MKQPQRPGHKLAIMGQKSAQNAVTAKKASPAKQNQERKRSESPVISILQLENQSMHSSSSPTQYGQSFGQGGANQATVLIFKEQK